MKQRNTVSYLAAGLFWLFWVFYAGSLIFYRMFLAGGSTNTHSLTPPRSLSAAVLYLVAIIVAVSMRWLVIPKVRNPFVAFIPFWFGLTVAEALTFCGIFVFPQQFSLFYYTNWLLLLQMMPLWKGKRDETPTA